MTIAHVPPRTWDTRGKAFVCSNAFNSVGNNGNHAIFPAKALDMSILVSVKMSKSKKLKKSRRKTSFHRELSSPFASVVSTFFTSTSLLLISMFCRIGEE